MFQDRKDSRINSTGRDFDIIPENKQSIKRVLFGQ